MDEPSLDDLRLFLAVACEGSLNAAAKSLSASPATLARRISQLEQQIGRSLFNRQHSGYELTADGASLRERVLQLDAVRADIADWLATPATRPVVRLSAGTWTCLFLVERIGRLHDDDDAFGLEFVTTEERLSIAYREVDIGLRNARPGEPNLAARRVAQVSYARYAAVDLELAPADEDRWPWLLVAPECARSGSAHWMVTQHLCRAVLQVSTSRTLLDLAIAGAGITVLPCFIGDQAPGLRRVGPLIDELTESQWLVMHSDTRHRPAVRTVIERIGAVIDDHVDLYRGECQRTAVNG